MVNSRPYIDLLPVLYSSVLKSENLEYVQDLIH